MKTSLPAAHRAIRALLVASALEISLWPGGPTVTPYAQEVNGATGRKIGLVIGNSAYSTAPLRNPGNDAKSLDLTLTRLGFVTPGPLLDMSLQAMSEAIRRFVASVDRGDTVFVYFAGHGLQIGGENYLIPVDFAATTAAEVRAQSYSASRLATELSASGADAVILILDACRDNPFKSSRGPGSTRSLADSPGLAPMPVDEFMSSSVMQPSAGMVVQFATGSGRTADDNARANNGLFATHLLAALQIPGLTVEEVLSRVRQDVNRDSRGRQVPLTISSLVRSVYFVTPTPTVSADDSLWESVKNERTPQLLDLYLKVYPSGAHAAEARLKADALRRSAEAAATEEADELYWEAVRAGTSPQGVDAYLRRFPSGRHAVEAKLVLANLRTTGGDFANSPDESQIRSVVNEYANAYGRFDVTALEQIFPTIPARQTAAIRNLKKTCRSYQVRVGQARIFQNGNDAALIEAETEYDCQPTTRQPNFVTRMTDIFRLQRTPTGRWIIESLGSLDRQ